MSRQDYSKELRKDNDERTLFGTRQDKSGFLKSLASYSIKSRIGADRLKRQSFEVGTQHQALTPQLPT